MSEKPHSGLVGSMERRLRDHLGTLRMLHSTGMLSDPRKLLEQLRHRRPAARIHGSLLQFRHAMSLLLGQRLGAFDALDGATLDFEQLAGALGIHQRSAEALARILEAEGVVERRDGGYRLSEVGRTFLSKRSKSTVGPMIELLYAQASSLDQIIEGMRTGSVPEALDVMRPGMHCEAFLDAVNGYLHLAAHDLLGRVDLPDVRTFIVGSMGVSFSAALMRRFPEARVTYGCLPHLVEHIPRLRDRYRVPAHRVTGMHGHGGEPEQDRWGDESFDLVLLTKKMILDPERGLGERFARKAHSVLSPGGALILWESLHTDDGPTPASRAMEALMDLGASPQGLVQTENSIFGVLRGIGFESPQVVPCLGGRTTFVVARMPS